MAASKRDRSNVSDSPSGDSESDSRLPSPPKRSKPARQDQRQRERQSHGGHGSGSEDGHGAQGKTKQDKSRKKVGTPDDNGTDGDVESEEETTKATSFDKFGSTAVHETVTRSVVRHVDFDAMLDPKPRTNVPKPVLMPRRVLLAKANSAGQRKDGPPRDTTSDHHHDEPQPDRPSPPDADSTPSASPGLQVAPLPVQPSSTPAVQHSSVPPVNPAPTALQYVPGFIPSSRHRFKAADYCGDSKSVILRASRQYEGYIIGRDAFPDAVKQRVWAQTAWEDACRVVGVTLVCDDNARKLVCATVTNMSSQARSLTSAVQVRLLQKTPTIVRGPIAKDAYVLSAQPQPPARSPGSLRLAPNAVGDPPTLPVGVSRRTQHMTRAPRRHRD
ncbi:hypothetical protein EV122DRAFT_256633 [Schizophyllum commune]